MVARFTKDKYGWRCTKVWLAEENYEPMFYDRLGKALYVKVASVPRTGFCRKPHTYI
jgi:hypothetical protein